MRSFKLPLVVTTLLSTFACWTGLASAGPPLVPPQLVAACAKLGAGAPCTVHFESKTLSGVCQELPDRSRACLPPKRARSHKPPPKSP